MRADVPGAPFPAFPLLPISLVKPMTRPRNESLILVLVRATSRLAGCTCRLNG